MSDSIVRRWGWQFIEGWNSLQSWGTRRTAAGQEIVGKLLYFLFDVGSLDILWSLILIYFKIDKVSKLFTYLFFLSVNLVFESPAQSAFAHTSSIGLHFAPIIKLKFFVLFKYLMVLLTALRFFLRCFIPSA